jgi:hypothetical protein
MKNYGTLITVAMLVALPACTYHGNDGRGAEYGYSNSGSQYRAHDEDNHEYADNDMNEHRHHWSGDKSQMKAGVDRFFAKVDTNHDGYISRKEFIAHMNKKFDEIDTNHDGKLSRAEVWAWKRKEMHEHGGMHDERPGEEVSNPSEHDDSEGSNADNVR